MERGATAGKDDEEPAGSSVEEGHMILSLHCYCIDGARIKESISEIESRAEAGETAKMPGIFFLRAPLRKIQR